MRNLGKILVITAIAITLTTSMSFSENAISVSQIQGLDPGRGLMIDQAIRYYVRYEVDSMSVYLIQNGYRLYSPDGAEWATLLPMQVIMLSSYFDPVNGIDVYDGLSEDTIHVHGFSGANPPVGFPSGFNQEVFFIQTGVTEEHIGKTLCFDSSSVIRPYGGAWIWLDASSGAEIYPTWSGPYCYEIVDCCIGNRGDLNGDGVGPNIVDLNRLVNFLFRGASAPICKNESDVNGDGMPHNIIDLNYLVNYIHRGGPAAPACP